MRGFGSALPRLSHVSGLLDHDYYAQRIIRHLAPSQLEAAILFFSVHGTLEGFHDIQKPTMETCIHNSQSKIVWILPTADRWRTFGIWLSGGQVLEN
jgi:hypothetical protein